MKRLVALAGAAPAMSSATELDVTVVQDHIAQRGGAERVLRSLKRLPVASLTVRTSVYVAERTYPELAELDIRPMWFSRLPTIRRNHRRAFPLMAPAFALAKTSTPLTLCCTAGWSHGVRTSGRKVAYWFAPARWIHQRPEYVGSEGAVARFIHAVAPILDWFDRRAVSTIDRHLAVSHEVADRLQRTYGIEAEVLHPPVVLDAPPEPFHGIEGPFIILVSRLIGYKNVDIVIKAFRELPDLTLYVVGDGPLRAELEKLAGENVRFTGTVTDGQLATLYGSCEALVTAAFEDFGLTPVEAALFGKPSAALRAGGLLESVQEGVTGVFFDEATPASVARGVRKVLDGSWDHDKIRQHAAIFGEDAFLERLHTVLLVEAQHE